MGTIGTPTTESPDSVYQRRGPVMKRDIYGVARGRDQEWKHSPSILILRYKAAPSRRFLNSLRRPSRRMSKARWRSQSLFAKRSWSGPPLSELGLCGHSALHYGLCFAKSELRNLHSDSQCRAPSKMHIPRICSDH